MFPATTSPSKWATEPALDAGTSVASPITNTFGFALDCRVCRSAGTKPSSSPRPGERPMEAWPPCSGITTARSNGTSRPSKEMRRPPGPSTSPVLNSVTTLTPLSLSKPLSSRLHAGLVNAPSSGVT